MIYLDHNLAATVGCLSALLERCGWRISAQGHALSMVTDPQSRKAALSALRGQYERLGAILDHFDSELVSGPLGDNQTGDEGKRQ